VVGIDEYLDNRESRKVWLRVSVAAGEEDVGEARICESGQISVVLTPRDLRRGTVVWVVVSCWLVFVVGWCGVGGVVS